MNRDVETLILDAKSRRAALLSERLTATGDRRYEINSQLAAIEQELAHLLEESGGPDDSSQSLHALAEIRQMIDTIHRDVSAIKDMVSTTNETVITRVNQGTEHVESRVALNNRVITAILGLMLLLIEVGKIAVQRWIGG